MVPFQQTHGKSFAIPVFFKLLTVSCASRKFRQKYIGEGMIFTFTSNKWIGNLWVLNEGQKMDEGVKYLKVSNTWPIFALILSAAEVSPYTNFERGVV